MHLKEIESVIEDFLVWKNSGDAVTANNMFGVDDRYLCVSKDRGNEYLLDISMDGELVERLVMKVVPFYNTLSPISNMYEQVFHHTYEGVNIKSVLSSVSGESVRCTVEVFLDAYPFTSELLKVMEAIAHECLLACKAKESDLVRSGKRKRLRALKASDNVEIRASKFRPLLCKEINAFKILLLSACVCFIAMFWLLMISIKAG